MRKMRVTKKHLIIFLLLIFVLFGFSFRYLLFYKLVTSTMPPTALFFGDEIGTIPKSYWKSINPLQFKFEMTKASTAGDYDIKAWDDDSVIFTGAHGPLILYDQVDTKSFMTFSANGYGYAKDRYRVYYSYDWDEHPKPLPVIVVEGADPNTFTVGDENYRWGAETYAKYYHPEWYARDARSLYYAGEKITAEEWQTIKYGR